jgi:hypothetical protein
MSCNGRMSTRKHDCFGIQYSKNASGTCANIPLRPGERNMHSQAPVLFRSVLSSSRSACKVGNTKWRGGLKRSKQCFEKASLTALARLVGGLREDRPVLSSGDAKHFDLHHTC